MKLKCPEPESNQWHEDFQSSALPTELSGHPEESCDSHVRFRLLFSDMCYYTRESFKCQLFFSTFLNFFKNFFNLLFLPHSQRPHLHLQIFRKQWKNRLFFIFLHLFDFDGWQILLGVFIMHVTKNTDKPMRKRSIWPMYRHREFRMVETERLTVSEWTSEGSLERLLQ